MSDKRLLERCGTGKGYLTETRSGSFRPPGLRIRRAEVRTMKPVLDWCLMCGKVDETGNVLSAIESKGLRKQMTSVRSNLEPVSVPREVCPGA